jgi:hypothetical protein
MPAMGPFGSMGEESPPPVIRVTLAMTSFDDIFSKLFAFAGHNFSPEEVGRPLSLANKGTSFNIVKSKVSFQSASTTTLLNCLDLVRNGAGVWYALGS